MPKQKTVVLNVYGDGSTNETHYLEREHFLRETFPEMMARKDAGKCPLCAKPTTITDMTTEAEQKEFQNSGMCVRCQTKYQQML